MKFPVYFHISGLTISAHLVFETLAYSVGFATFRWLRRNGDPVPEGVRWSVIAAAALGAVIGSKVLYWLEDPLLMSHHWHDPRALLGGKTIVGGLIGGLIAVEYAKKKIGFAGRTGDLFALPLCVGTAVGRIGCFLAGLNDDTYGRPTSVPWAIDFGDGIRRHPTQLYEMLYLLGLAVFLLWRMRRPLMQGDIFKLFMVGYFCWRLVIDFLKPGPRFLVFSTLQWACCGMVVYYFHDIGRWIARGPTRAPAAGDNSRSSNGSL